MTTRARASASRLRAPVLAAPVDVQDDLEQLSQERSEILEKLKIVEQRIIAATQAQKEEDERAAMGKHNDELLEQELPPSEEQSVDQAAAIETLIAAGVAVESAAASYCPSFGYLSKSGGNYVRTNASVPGGVPSGLLDLGFRNFKRELNELTTSIRRFVQGDSAEPLVVSQTNPMENAEVMALREALRNLTLSNEAVWDREKSRPSVEAPLVLTIPYYVLCYALDYCFDGRPLARFWFLETVARMPYFSYITMLHLYETLGWWRRSAETKRVHFAEEWNEFNHLMIMESLGGDQRWVDRFLAQHAAIVYFIVLTLLWLVSPTLSYNFSELIEAHAVDTYGEFVDANEALLKQIPPPTVAKAYYESDDLYFFDEFQTARPRGSRRPKISSLYDVFSCVRDDEAEHVATMRACQDPTVKRNAPGVERAIAITAAVAAAAVFLFTGAPAAIEEGAEAFAAEGVAEGLTEGLAESLQETTETGVSAFRNVAEQAVRSATAAIEAFVELLLGNA